MIPAYFRLLAAGLLLSACQTAGPAAQTGASPTTPPAPLRNTRWVLRQLGSEAVTVPAEGREADLLLRTEDTRVQGNAGCNRFSGTYEQPTPEQVRFSKLLSTKMACPALDTETRFMGALGQISYFRIVGDTLRLYAGPPAETAPLLRLEAVYTR
ncbi:META domain-containing protein [Hymenobacter jeollabukensis]|uniref:META domain-containing protein n=1 Tax=Hymenobacter jeollabukensis TaxID=2025313 RepID=A0A5R8WWH5_9BACT|nr:META domain-containing protein [Hymenobacter jeollabukensis]TLM96887.1 META domain-containing protein [Hymenobacter jeollabukensis]